MKTRRDMEVQKSSASTAKADDFFSRIEMLEKSGQEVERYELTFQKGETIFKQGTIVPHIAFVKNGMVKVMLESGNRKQPLCIEKEGFIGLESMYNDKYSQYTVVALTDVTIVLIEIEGFKRAMESDGVLAVKVIESINIRTKHLYERIVTLTQKQGPGRVADVILCLSERIFESNSFCSPCTRKEMAEMCALSLESMSRILKDFKDEGIIELSTREVTILNREELELISRVS